MLTTGTTAYMQLPNDTGKRVLHPIEITATAGGVFTAKGAVEAFGDLEPGAELLSYYEIRREFMQHAARIEATQVECATDDETTAHEGLETMFNFSTVGDPVSAESRQCYRIATVLENLHAAVGAERDCPLTDVSATGFSVITREPLNIGSTVDVTLQFDGTTFGGKATVQSVNELEPDRVRCGFHFVSERGVNTLEDGLQKISMDVQRRQLRRMSGAA